MNTIQKFTIVKKEFRPFIHYLIHDDFMYKLWINIAAPIAIATMIWTSVNTP